MRRSGMVWLTALAVLVTAGSAWADWHTLVIRNATTSGNPPAIVDNTDYGVPAKEFIIAEGGQKAAWSTSVLDGFTVGEIAQLAVTRFDDRTRFAPTSGGYSAPYFNIWITDGSGQYAVIANEPSDSVFQPLYSNGYDLTWADISDKPVKVYENSDISWLPNNGVGLTFDDIKDFVIQAPSPAELAAGWPGLGTGAPRELGTNIAYGFNWILGDTLSNYVSGDPGYILAQPGAGAFVTTNYTVTPQILAAGKPEFSAPHGTGDNPFGYDWDSRAPDTAAGAPTGYGSSSFYANVDHSDPDPDSRYVTLRIGLRDLFGREVTIGELTALSYWTNKPTDQTAMDYRVTMYTTFDDSDNQNGASWYRSRLQASPHAAANLSAPADTWNQWTTGGATNEFRFYESTSKRSYSNMAWTDITDGETTWDYSGEEIMMIDIGLGTRSSSPASWWTGESRLDGLRIELANGQIADIDLAAGTAWQVATVHGHDQFTISDGGSTLLYHAQPRNSKEWYWFNNNGSAPDVLATGGFGPNGWRDGSRTFAVSDVAVGKKLNEIKLAFEYNNTLGGYTTMNFFLTDGNGKFGIFAPTSLGIQAISEQVVVDGWTRITLDLTKTSIADSTAVAIYEHNGFTDVYGNPYTTMTWGDIKEYTIAGMYDYQRSPAHGWSKWGKMFDPINIAGEDAVVNGYGLALIWGDTVGNTAYATQQRQIRNVQVSFDTVDYLGTFADAQIRDILELNVQPDSLYVKPSESVTLNMDVKNLQQMVNGCQALIGYDSEYFPAAGTVAPGGGGVWEELIYEVWRDIAGELDTAIGVQLTGGAGTDDDGTVAIIALTAGTKEGTTQMVFRADGEYGYATMLSDLNAEPVWPTKIDSQTIVIDGTDPTVDTFSADPLCTKTTTTLTFTVSDALAGVDYVDVYVDGAKVAEDVASPYALDMSGYATDCYDVTLKVVDKAGNEADSSAVEVCVDKTAPAISNIAAEQDGEDVLCPAVAVQGVVNIYVDVTDAGCADLVVPPALTVDGIGAAVYVDVSGDTYHYQVTISGATANGAHTITVEAADALGNTASDNAQAICVDKNQITGQVELESLVGGLTRTVTFVATGGVKKTWDIPVVFPAGSAVGTFTLTEVPDGTTALSAKTNWNLRRKVACSLDGDGQASADFTGTAKLRGGDIKPDNYINILDYSVLKSNYLSSNDVADIDGDGTVGLVDYSLMRSNWFQPGDAE